MPDREIIKIPANRTLADLRRKKRKLRVAAYCRVSTEEEEQQSSFEIQVAYRIIERITVLSKEQIQIRFAGGYEMTQSLQ